MGWFPSLSLVVNGEKYFTNEVREVPNAMTFKQLGSHLLETKYLIFIIFNIADFLESIHNPALNVRYNASL